MIDRERAEAQVDAMVERLDAEWLKVGVGPVDRAEMSAEVAADLRAAIDDGADPRTLLSPDLITFARQAAAARDSEPLRVELPRIVAGELFGAGLVFAAAWAVLPMVHHYLTSHVQLKHRYPVAGPTLAALILGGILLAGALLGLRLALAGRPSGGETVRRAAILVPAGFLSAGLLAVSITSLTGQRDSSSSAIVDMVAATLGCIAATVRARRGALLRPDAPPR